MPQNLKQLTSLRFFAAIWVVCYHYWPSLAAAKPALVGKGYLGVELFFVLSGFILSHVYLHSFGEQRFRYADFLWARLARIYPVHFATLAGLGVLIGAAALVGIHAGDNVVIWGSLPAHLTLTQAWGLAPQGGWNHPSWSISAEWFAYLSFPAFAAVAWSLRRRPGVAVAGSLGLLFGLYAVFNRLAGFPLTEATILWGALRIVPCFAYGCAIYLLWNSGVVRSRNAALTGLLASLAGAAVSVLLGAPDAVTVSMFGGLILALAGLSSTGSALLTRPLWVYLGEVSFAVYMVCIPWQLVFENGAHKLLHLQGQLLAPWLWGAMIAGVVPAAMVVHHLAERPAREAMRRHGVPFARTKPAVADVSPVI